MIITDISNLKPFSKKPITVSCDYNTSPDCKLVWESKIRTVRLSMEKHDGQNICRKCEDLRTRKSPSKYINLDDDFLEKLDTKEKNYVMGWLGSDGCFAKSGTAIRLRLGDIDLEHLSFIRDLICPELKIEKDKENNTHRFCVYSKKMCHDGCNHFNVNPGPKSKILRIPELDSQLGWYFISGYFCGDGSINSISNKRKSIVASISSSCRDMLYDIGDFVNIKCSISSLKAKKPSIRYSGQYAIEFMSKIFQEQSFALPRKYLRWIEWQNYYKGKL